MADNDYLHKANRLVSFPTLTEALIQEPQLALVYFRFSQFRAIAPNFDRWEFDIFAPSSAACGGALWSDPLAVNLCGGFF
jgi:hypothetical protein